MRLFSTCVLVIASLPTWACAKRAPERMGLAPGTPHVTWVIMFGDRDTPDREFACQSDPPTACVIPFSPAEARTFAHMHFYFHGAGAETKYEGTIAIGFLQGSPETQKSQTNITVKKNESIANQSVMGVLTSTPGNYAVTFDLTATMTDTGRKQPIRESVQVQVQAQ